MTRSIYVNARFLNHAPGGVRRAAEEVAVRLGNAVVPVAAPPGWRGLRGHLWEQIRLPTKIPAGALLWSPANTGPLLTEHQALTVHDLAVYDCPDGLPHSFRLWYRALLPVLMRRSLVVFAPSDFTRRQILARFGLANERVTVIPNGVGPPFELKGVEKPSEFGTYVVVVGVSPARKNFGKAVRAWRIARREFPALGLVVVGRPPAGFAPIAGLRWVAAPSDVSLARIYRQAVALVYLSDYEGFGLPLLEAMACGTPVVAANAGALPETAGGACLLVPPSEAGHALCQVLADQELQRGLVESGLKRAAEFGWERAARLTWAALQAAAGQI